MGVETGFSGMHFLLEERRRNEVERDRAEVVTTNERTITRLLPATRGVSIRFEGRRGGNNGRRGEENGKGKARKKKKMRERRYRVGVDDAIGVDEREVRVPTLSKPSKELNVNVAGSALMIGIYVGHQGVTRAIYPLADDASVLLLSLGVLVGNVAFQGCFAA